MPWLAAVHFAPRLQGRSWTGFCLLISALVRLAAWQVPPRFSDDLLRYRFEGRVQARGENPYAVRPSERRELVRAEEHDKMPGLVHKAVYGPVILLTEWVAYQVAGENTLALRWPYQAADLLTLAVLAWRFGARSVVYGWCPLAALEFWSAGHNDALCVLALTLALWAFSAERHAWGWMALACAVLTKWWPLMLVPIVVGRDRRLWRSLAWMAVPAVPLLAWYGWPPLENTQVASGFVGGWRNNDSVFGGLLWLAGGDLYRAKYAAFVLVAAWIAWLAWRSPWELPVKCLAAVAGLLTLSANVHPWYLTWLLPFLAEAPVWAGLVWVALVPVTYETAVAWSTGAAWEGVRASRWLVYLPVWLVLLVTAWRTRGTRTL